MQIKPFFEEYKEIKRTPLLKDDRGVQYSLVHFTALKVDKPTTATRFHPEHVQFKNPNDGIESVNTFRLPDGYTVRHEYEGYAVMSDVLNKHSNGSTSYDETLYWKQPKKLQTFEVDGMKIIEVFEGQNSFFQEELPTMNTTFGIYPLGVKNYG